MELHSHCIRVLPFTRLRVQEKPEKRNTPLRFVRKNYEINRKKGELWDVCGAEGQSDNDPQCILRCGRERGCRVYCPCMLRTQIHTALSTGRAYTSARPKLVHGRSLYRPGRNRSFRQGWMRRSRNSRNKKGRARGTAGAGHWSQAFRTNVCTAWPMLHLP